MQEANILTLMTLKSAFCLQGELFQMQQFRHGNTGGGLLPHCMYNYSPYSTTKF
jgi:hypothetical protein